MPKNEARRIWRREHFVWRMYLDSTVYRYEGHCEQDRWTTRVNQPLYQSSCNHPRGTVLLCNSPTSPPHASPVSGRLSLAYIDELNDSVLQFSVQQLKQ